MRNDNGKEEIMKHIKFHWAFLALFLYAQITVLGTELLINGDFEIGTPEKDKAASFVCKGWRRHLWKENALNSWLTDGTLDPKIGADNQALEFRWGATSIYQVFSAVAGEAYQFSVDYFNPGTPESRWQPRIQVQWMNAAHQPLGPPETIAEADNSTAPVKTWNTLRASATAPQKTAYGRIMLNINNRGEGKYFQKMFMDNASVQGVAGSANLPVTFINTPYPILLKAIPEGALFRDSLTRFADDKDNDALIFTKVSGPGWITLKANGEISGTPRFEDAGKNKLVVKVEDGRGSSETGTLIIPVIGHLRLANIYNDNMVLQRNAPMPIRGTALPNQPVEVSMSTGESASTTSDTEGHWSLTFTPMKADTGGAVTMTITSPPRQLQITNLVVGDVWFCSGQSNMDWILQNTDGAEEEIASASHPRLRLLKTPQTSDSTPWEDLKTRADWQVCSPQSAREFSAVAYYFGKNLLAELDIPIGLINSSQGGTQIEKWAATLLPPGSVTFYNSRVLPYTKIPIKGVIWYQAEANIGDGPLYTDKMKTLVNDWRSVWGIGAFPFYFVQLAPFNYGGDAVYQLPEMWDAQTRAADQIPNAEMAVINDIGNISNIHPRNKAPVGKRLALLALHGAYGRSDLEAFGPRVKTVTREGSNLRVQFDHIGGGLASRDGEPLNWFEIAGTDKHFVPATARIDNDSVLLSAPSIPAPEWVRFAWHETAEPNLMNKEGLPANGFPMRQVTTE